MAVVGNSSALSGLAIAACHATGLTVAEGYPCDISPQAGAHDFADALADAAVDDRVDALVVVFAPPLPGQLPDEDADFAAALGSVALAGEKPTVATFLLGRLPPGVPAYPSVEEAVRALSRVVGYADWLRHPPGVLPPLSGVDPSAHELEGPPSALLEAYGIRVQPSRSAASLDEALAAATDLGYPVALKAAGGALRHRLDLGAVRLALADEDDLRAAHQELVTAFGQPPAGPVDGPARRRLHDRGRRGPGVRPGNRLRPQRRSQRTARRPRLARGPLTDRAAAALVDEPRAAPLLHGYRGSEPVDRAALIDLLLRVGRLADEHPHVRALSLNPVLSRPDGLTILHASIEMGEAGARPDTGPPPPPKHLTSPASGWFGLWDGLVWVGPARSGPARSGPARSGPARSGPARSGSARSGSARLGPVWPDLT
nr:hypothetical protein GCM10020092_019760 [Actinoplanes digitatis]